MWKGTSGAPVSDAEFIRRALVESGLMEEYWRRSVYQRNDYLRWIDGARREEAR
jgi:squalene cyclase